MPRLHLRFSNRMFLWPRWAATHTLISTIFHLTKDNKDLIITTTVTNRIHLFLYKVEDTLSNTNSPQADTRVVSIRHISTKTKVINLNTDTWTKLTLTAMEWNTKTPLQAIKQATTRVWKVGGITIRLASRKWKRAKLPLTSLKFNNESIKPWTLLPARVSCDQKSDVIKLRMKRKRINWS